LHLKIGNRESEIMVTSGPNYVESVPNGGYRVAGSRVGLESVVLGYLNGQSAEAIQENFPTLSLEKIHGTIAFYLHHRAEVDRYLADLAARWEELRNKSETDNAELLARIRAARSEANRA
jgi:uncharacterized protein (DUF433 family)